MQNVLALLPEGDVIRLLILSEQNTTKRYVLITWPQHLRFQYLVHKNGLLNFSTLYKNM